MINVADIFEAKSLRGLVVSSAETAKIGTLTLPANKAYDKVLGFNFSIKNTTKVMVGDVATYVENATPYIGGARVSITDGNGKVILPMVPYELLKHSPEEQFVNRFIEVANISGDAADIYVRFEFTPTPKVDLEDVRYSIDATALYSQRKKTL